MKKYCICPETILLRLLEKASFKKYKNATLVECNLSATFHHLFLFISLLTVWLLLYRLGLSYILKKSSESKKKYKKTAKTAQLNGDRMSKRQTQPQQTNCSSKKKKQKI